MAAFSLGFAFLAVSLWFWQGGLMDGEGTVFTRHGWDERPILERVFDPAKTEWGEYQGRELATLLNYMDARWYLAWVSRGVGWWLAPLTGMVSYLLGGWVLGWFTHRQGCNRTTSILLMVLYWGSLTAGVTMAVYHRCSRPCLLPVLLALLAFGCDRIWHPAATSKGRFFNAGIVLSLSLVLGLIDRQGFIHSLLAAGVFSVLAFLRKTGGYRIAIAAVVGSILTLFYDVVLGPAIIETVNGYRPSLEFQRIDLKLLFQDARYLVQAAQYVNWVVFHSVGGWLGGGLLLVGLIVSVAMGRKWYAHSQAQGGRGLPWFLVLTAASVGAVIAAILVSFGAMMMRMEAIHTLFSTRLYYYPTSIHAWVLFGISLGAASLPTSGRSLRMFQSVILISIAANFLSWKPLHDALWRCQWFSVVLTESRVLQKSIREKKADPAMDLTFAKLFARIAKIDPEMKKVKSPKATIGDGFYNAEFRAGRWMHWLEEEAFLKLSPVKAGTHSLKLAFYDEGRGVPHQIDVLRDEQVVGSFSIPAEGGWIDLAMKLDLPKGETRLLFRGSLPKRMFPIQFPGAVTSHTYHAKFAVGIPEVSRVD